MAEVIRRRSGWMCWSTTGVAPQSRVDVLETSLETFDRVLESACRHVLPVPVGRTGNVSRAGQRPVKPPRIVNIGSISAYTASINRGEYCISKAGVTMVTQLFAALAPHGIGV